MQMQTQNPADHSCRFCPIKTQKLAAASHLKFRALTLRQQSLLKVAYMSYARGGIPAQEIDNLPLPLNLKEEIKCVHEEIDRWDCDTRTLYRMVGRRSASPFRDFERMDQYDDQLDWTDYRCFTLDLHWIPKRNVIDRRATANMILQCNVGFDRRCEFLLAAANCLETEVVRLWPLLSDKTREQWSSYYCFLTQHPVFAYWIGKVTDSQLRKNRALRNITSSCLKPGEHQFETLKYFWPMIVESSGGIESDEMKRLLVHSFHMAIQCGNRQIAIFIWDQTPPQYYPLMICASVCCQVAHYYYTFHKAVECGEYSLVRMMWDTMDNETQNRVLLAEHSKAFCKSSECGYIDITRMLLQTANHNQKFILLYAQSCLAFRLACKNGHAEIISLLWANSSLELRRKMLTACEYDAVVMACKSGHLKVIKYLWENLGDDLKTLMETLMENCMMLSKCICEAASAIVAEEAKEKKQTVDGEPILRYIFCTTNSPPKSYLIHALLFNNGAALTALLERGVITGKWDTIAELFNGFQSEERTQLHAKLSNDQAHLGEFVLGAVDCVPSVALTTIKNDVSDLTKKCKDNVDE